MTTPPPRPEPGFHRDSKSNLLDAAREAVKDREAAAAAATVAANTPARRKRRLSVEIMFGLVGAIVLLIQPEWLVGPDAPPPETPAVATASFRVTMVRERARVLEYQRRLGRLPAALSDAGVTVQGLEYQRIGATDFRIRARLGDSVLVLASGDSIGGFLGNSFKTLQGRGGK